MFYYVSLPGIVFLRPLINLGFFHLLSPLPTPRWGEAEQGWWDLVAPHPVDWPSPWTTPLTESSLAPSYVHLPLHPLSSSPVCIVFHLQCIPLLKVLTNERRCGFNLVSCDWSRLKLFTLKFSKESVQTSSCERPKTSQRTLCLSFEKK